MLPKGAVHLPRTSSGLPHSFDVPDRRHLTQSLINTYADKGTAKIAKSLGVDYAEAVVRA